MTTTVLSVDRLSGSVDRPVYQPVRPNLLANFDFAWAAVVMTSMLYVQLLQTITALILFASVPAYFLLRPERLTKIWWTFGMLGLLPAFALLSAFWSPVPQTTLYYGTEYLITALVGMVLGAALQSNQALLGLFVGFAAHAIGSMLIGEYTLVGRAGSSEVELAFIGIMASKNQGADASGTGMLVASAVAVLALSRRQLLLAFAALVILGIDVWMVLRAESTGVLVGAIISALAMIAFQLGRVFTVQARTLMFAMIATIGTLAFSMRALWFDVVLSTLLKSAGKDTTLTGRTFIWDQAQRMMDANPAFGLGYSAFWNPGNPPAERIWAFAGIGQKQGFNFHNTPIEILVHLGYVGFAFFAVVAGIAALILALRVTRKPDAFGVFAVAYLLFMTVRFSVESLGFSAFSYSTALIFTVLSFGLRRGGGRGESGTRS